VKFPLGAYPQFSKFVSEIQGIHDMQCFLLEAKGLPTCPQQKAVPTGGWVARGQAGEEQ